MKTSPIAFVLSLGTVLCMGNACSRSGSALSQDAAAKVDVSMGSGGNMVGGSDGGGGSATSTGGGGMGGSAGRTSGTGGVGGSGGTAGRSISGGSLATAGTGGGGTTLTGGSGGTPNGVLLTARYDGTLQATWQNQTSQSIFLRGCGTVGWSRLEGADWVDYGSFIMCGTEGVGIEVLAGSSYTDPYTKPGTWNQAGSYRLYGDYSVGCTSGLPLSKAGCSASVHVTSNELVIVGDAGVASDSSVAEAGSILTPQCLTKDGVTGWGLPGQDLICTASCTGCTAICSLIGTRSEGWYTKCGAVDALGSTGCGISANATLITWASCATGTGSDGGSGAGDTYSGCMYVGGFDRLGVIKTSVKNGSCTTLILRDGAGTKDLGLTISSGWTVQSAVTWPASAAACTSQTPPAGAINAVSGTGTVTVHSGSTGWTLDIDAALTFPVGDSGASQSETLQVQAVAPTTGC
jgi:hypothetical protein